jgi:hypothetical protein
LLKSHKHNQPNTNSTIKTAGESVEVLHHSKDNSERREKYIQHTKARLIEPLKKK